MALATFKVKKETVKKITNVIYKEIVFKCTNNGIRFLESVVPEKITQGIINIEDYTLHKDIEVLEEHDHERFFIVKKAPIRAFADRCLGDDIIVELSTKNIKLTDDTNDLRFGRYRLESLTSEKLNEQMLIHMQTVSRLEVRELDVGTETNPEIQKIIYNAFMLDNDDYICTHADERSYSKYKGDVDYVRWEFRVNTEEVELIETCYRPNNNKDQDVWEYKILAHVESGMFSHPTEIQLYFNTSLINNYIINSGTTRISLFVGNPQTIIPVFSIIDEDFQVITLVKDLGGKPT